MSFLPASRNLEDADSLPSISFRKWWLLIALVFALSQAKAQKYEWGLGAGAINYGGELGKLYLPVNARPAINPWLKINYSKAAAMRLSLLVGQVAGTASQGNLYTKQINPSSFKRPIVEAAVMGEYNFLDWRGGRVPDLKSPYLFGGIGIVYHGTTNEEVSNMPPVSLALPFGIGYKIALNRHLNIGAEIGVRKLFTGLLDGRNNQFQAQTGLTPSGSSFQFPEPQRGQQFMQDWYAFSGLTISYTIITIKCPSSHPDPAMPGPDGTSEATQKRGRR